MYISTAWDTVWLSLNAFTPLTHRLHLQTQWKHTTKEVLDKWDLWVEKYTVDVLDLADTGVGTEFTNTQEIWGPDMWYRRPHCGAWAIHTHTVLVDLSGDKVSADSLQRTSSDVTTSLMMHWWCLVEGLAYKCYTGEDSHLWPALFHKNPWGWVLHGQEVSFFSP